MLHLDSPSSRGLTRVFHFGTSDAVGMREPFLPYLSPTANGSVVRVPCMRGSWNGNAQVFLEAPWQAGLAEYDDLQGIAWRWQSIDGATMKAPLAREAVGPNPT